MAEPFDPNTATKEECIAHATAHAEQGNDAQAKQWLLLAKKAAAAPLPAQALEEIHPYKRADLVAKLTGQELRAAAAAFESRQQGGAAAAFAERRRLADRARGK